MHLNDNEKTAIKQIAVIIVNNTVHRSVLLIFTNAAVQMCTGHIML